MKERQAHLEEHSLRMRLHLCCKAPPASSGKDFLENQALYVQKSPGDLPERRNWKGATRSNGTSTFSSREDRSLF